SRRWQPYRAPAGGGPSSVVGDLRVLHGFPGPPLGPDREILVHLPPGTATSGRRFPVLYMHDGQNLFDAATSYSGEWEVDETLAVLAREGLELIVVGIPNAGDGRYAEYTPYKGRRPGVSGGLGRAYLRWLTEVVKPEVDAAWPTRPEREATGIMGSSLGGLVSLWAAVAHPATFGLVGSMSTAVTPGQNEIIRRLARLPVPPARAYLDIGEHEGSDAPSPGLERRWSSAMIRESRQIRDALVASGLREGETLRLVEDPGAIHHEAHWARRLPDALRFLFGPPCA
ncbi:MAG TPA: alpha/beta hydrolase-fold protein, partial [Candidatus Limnocylindrales bacterium]|nr:alpha/beta hydrolase-fold protein [Candidatus Limnocylindrales bacterium]